MESWLKDIWTALSAASPVAAMVAFLFLVKAWRDQERERSERIGLSKAKDDLQERTINGLNDSAHAAERLADAVNALAVLVKETGRERK